MDMQKTYDPKNFEDRIYDQWEKSGLFRAEIDENKVPFTIMMPPPNITGQTVTDIGLERNGISVRLADQTELLFDSDEHNLRQHMAGTRTKGSGDRMMRHHGNSR